MFFLFIIFQTLSSDYEIPVKKKKKKVE
jgi:hypothetical protein